VWYVCGYLMYNYIFVVKYFHITKVYSLHAILIIQTAILIVT